MTIFKYKFLFGFLSLTLCLFSCGINGNIMFKTPKDGSFKYDSIPLKPKEDYKIAIDDKLSFALSTNKGKSLIEGITGTTIGNGNINNSAYYASNVGLVNEYLVRNDGKVEIPLLGKIQVEGLTIEEFQDTLVKLFSTQYQDPFIQVKITNRRCLVFTGNGSSAMGITLENANTTLLEVLGKSGGISPRGKAQMVKVMRKTSGKREIYLIDISKIDGLKYADMIIQGNDYIYVEPRPELIKGLLNEIVPITTLANTILLFYTIIKKY
jgi:polysaccharide export outer membrane protein